MSRSSNGASVYAAGESNPDRPVRNPARFPLRQRRAEVLTVALTWANREDLAVPPEGFEPSSLRLKGGDPADWTKGAHVLSLGIEPSFWLLIRQLRPPCRPERIWLATSESNRALPPYQSGPFTGWVAASGRWRCRSSRSDPARAFKARCRAGGAPSKNGGGRSTRNSPCEGPAAFQTVTAPWRFRPPEEGGLLESHGSPPRIR